ncbi:hypothetical protein DWV29_09435 [Enterocloster asparagiformis]|uniref:Uncharacterized protein n=1 Tax=Enterocloster asparagiformis TaxID=333367 RepID=A0A413FGK1_9FIRM|nr:hypothetical protein DWV29_09435 [Enterocloster asparagiformis]
MEQIDREMRKWEKPSGCRETWRAGGFLSQWRRLEFAAHCIFGARMLSFLTGKILHTGEKPAKEVNICQSAY